MKKTLLIAVILLAVPAFAAKIKDPKCGELTGIDEKYTPEYLAVVDGYNKAGKEVASEIDMSGIVSESKNVKQECAKQKTSKIASVRKNMPKGQTDSTIGTDMAATGASSSSKGQTKVDLKKAKCEDFIAWGEEFQPVAAYWVAGHSKTGKVKNGEIDEAFLARPVATLIEDCKAQPTASFYDKTKAWFKKHI